MLCKTNPKVTKSKSEIEQFIDFCEYEQQNCSDEELTNYYETTVTITMMNKTLTLPFDAVVYNMIIDGLKENKTDLE